MPNKKKTLFICKYCKREFKLNSNLHRHMSCAHGGKFKCPKCDLSFDTTAEIKAHVEKEHVKVELFECNECSITFVKEATYKRHMDHNHSDQNLYKCAECSKTFKTLVSLKSHQKVHFSGKHYSCSKCSQTFNTLSALTKHRLIHSDVKPPNALDKKVASASLNIHSKFKASNCHLCCQAFAKIKDLELHIMKEHRSEHDSRDSDYENWNSDRLLKIKEERDSESIIQSKRGRKRKASKITTEKGGELTNHEDSVTKKLQKHFKTINSPKRTKRQVNKPKRFLDASFKACEMTQKLKKDISSATTLKQCFICNECGLQFDSEKNLHKHVKIEHKPSSKKSSRQPHLNKESLKYTFQSNQFCSDISKTSKSSSLLPINNNANQFVILGQNPQPGLFYNNILPIQNHPSFNSLLNIGSTPNVQCITVPNPYQVQAGFGNVPKFDFDSENYISWLKKFVNKCEAQDYPLSPALLQNVSQVYEDIFNALINPSESLKKKENHFYLTKFYKSLSKFMQGHVKYILKRHS